MTEEEIKRGAGWTTEYERRMALEGLHYGLAMTKEQEERALQIMRDVLSEVKAGKVFDMDAVLEQWNRDDGERRLKSAETMNL